MKKPTLRNSATQALVAAFISVLIMAIFEQWRKWGSSSLDVLLDALLATLIFILASLFLVSIWHTVSYLIYKIKKPRQE